MEPRRPVLPGSSLLSVDVCLSLSVPEPTPHAPGPSLPEGARFGLFTSPSSAPSLPDTSFLLGGSLKVSFKIYCFLMSLHSLFYILEWTPPAYKVSDKKEPKKQKKRCLSIKGSYTVI